MTTRTARTGLLARFTPRTALRGAIVAASVACHAAGRLLNRWQWRLDGIDDPPRISDDQYAAKLRAHLGTRRAVVPDNPPSIASGRADLALVHTRQPRP